MNIVEVKNLGKRYAVSHEKDTLIRNILPYIFRRKYREEFWALRGIDFSLKRGISLGIVGPNGAGKSTLLNILAGIVTPTEGTIMVKGQVSSVLSLGAGFHPELTGEENIFLNGSILGMPLKELRAKLGSIIEFSELNNFIDAPIQTYSTGMLLRLGFAIAVHIDFDILLVDEILLVGDLYFQKKCFEKMEEFKQNGKMLIISSQSLSFIKSLTDRVLFLDKGRIVAIGDPENVVQQYENLRQNNNALSAKKDIGEAIKNKMAKESPENIKSHWGLKIGSEKAEIKKVRFLNKWKIRKLKFRTGEEMQIEIKFRVHKEIIEPHFGVAIFRKDYTYCYGPNTMFDGIKIGRLKPGNGKFSIKYHELLLSPGEYYVSVAIWDREEFQPYDYHCTSYKFKISGEDGESLYHEPYICQMETISEKIQNQKKSGQDTAITLNGHGQDNGKNIFKTGDRLRLILRDVKKQKTGLYSSIKIFREDNILCFEIYNYLRKYKSGKEKRYINVDIPKLHLLSGNYYIQFAGERLVDFAVDTEKEDHGIIYMPHNWNIKVM